MSFHLSFNESNKEGLNQYQNCGGVHNEIIKFQYAFNDNGIYMFPFSENIVEFAVPTSGVYKIEAWGARGGGGSTPTGPPGAYSKSFVLLNKDERIKILVGEKGYPGYNDNDFIYCGGGGGGTFITKGNTPLCVAGGGGSFSYYSHSEIQSHACGQSTQHSARLGTGQATLKMGGTASSHSGGGGGFEGNGADGSSYGNGGNSFINGGARQTSRTCGSNYGYGGFGGGASTYGYCGLPAGGGGYTGGSASNDHSVQGGGGGSYFEGNYSNEASIAISGCDSSLPTNIDTNGNGFALLTLLGGTTSDAANKKVSCSCYTFPNLWVFFVTLLSQQFIY
jgi:hypothetical protein